MNYFSLHSVGLLSLTLLALGCGRNIDPIGSNGSTTAGGAGASGAGGGGAADSAAATAGAGGSGSGSSAAVTAATSSSSGGGVAVLACTNAGISFELDVAPRLKEGCSGGGACHQGAFETPAGIHQYLVGQAAAQCADGRLNVAPGDPEGSYLIDKITNQDLCAGKPMPKTFGNGAWMPLPSEDIQAVYDWICSGAKDD